MLPVFSCLMGSWLPKPEVSFVYIAKDVIKEIEEFDGLEALRLEGNTVGVEAARVIAKALEKKSELKRCHWSDMFTGRLRSEIPPALVRTRHRHPLTLVDSGESVQPHRGKQG